MLRYEDSIDKEVLKQAFKATCKKRNTKNLTISGTQILNSIMHDDRLNSLWNSYQQKYEYAREISFEVAIDKAILIYEMMQGLR